MSEVKAHTGGRKKGDGKGKTGGRKKGTPNKVTATAKEAITKIVDGNTDKAERMLEMIVDPKEWLSLYLRFCEFVVPKKAAVNVQAEAKVSDLKSELADWADKEI